MAPSGHGWAGVAVIIPAMIGFDGEPAFRLRWQTERDDIREAVAWDLRHSRHLKKLRVGYGLGVVAAISAGLRATGGSSVGNRTLAAGCCRSAEPPQLTV